MNEPSGTTARRPPRSRRGPRGRAGPPGAGRLGLVLALACALALVLVPAGPAAPTDRCSPGWVCGWTDPGWTGVVSLVASDMPRYPGTTAYVGFNGGSSVWNGGRTWRADGRLRGRCFTAYSGVDYTGRQVTVRPGQGVSQLPADFGNIRSGRFHVCLAS
ncbi:peptidase inhibitor family I36 protein [Streptomyces sp. NPDC001568]|uniref:peptidase inhibitor family I36 protein n=1 Tax=Streptomyces sp. NPDC001568 TaxID=3364588 RepID=UPI00367399E9